MSDFVTGFYTKDGVKKYDYNALANLPEAGADITNTVISPNADYAEVGEWADGNPDGENRLGYFVSIAEVGDNTIKIRKATSEDDVRGVSVYNPAFSGNASKDKYGADGELLPQYNYIGVMGIVKIIDNGRCSVNGRCMPSDDGTAIPSTNNMGYAVLERVDNNHVLIAVEPGADMIQRVKADIKAIEDQIENGDFGGGGSPTVTIDELDADKVYFEGELVTTYTMGNIKELTNGSYTLIEAGKKKSLKQLWNEIYVGKKDPDVDEPQCTISVSGGKNEVGKTYTYPTATLTVDSTGRYSYGSIDDENRKYSADDGTGIVFAKGDITLKVGSKSASNTSNMTAGDTLKLQATGTSNVYGDNDTKYVFTATAKYTESDRVPINNLGEEVEKLRLGYDTEDDTTSITVTSKTATFTGYRNSFYGVLYDQNEITKDNIRSICDNKADSNKVKHGSIIASGKALKNGDSFTISIPESTNTVPIYGVFIAYPDGLKELAYVQDFNDSSRNIITAFGDNGTPEGIDIAGYNGYTAIKYKVYIQYFAQPYDTPNTYTVRIKGDNE